MVSPGEGDALLPTSIPAHPQIWSWPPWETSPWMARKQPAAPRALELVETAVFSANTRVARGNKHVDERGQQPSSGFWSQVVPARPRALPSTTMGLDCGPLQDLSHGHLMQPPAPLDTCLSAPYFPRMGVCPDILGEPSKPQLPGLQFGGGKMPFSP